MEFLLQVLQMGWSWAKPKEKRCWDAGPIRWSILPNSWWNQKLQWRPPLSNQLRGESIEINFMEKERNSHQMNVVTAMFSQRFCLYLVYLQIVFRLMCSGYCSVYIQSMFFLSWVLSSFRLCSFCTFWLYCVRYLTVLFSECFMLLLSCFFVWVMFRWISFGYVLFLALDTLDTLNIPVGCPYQRHVNFKRLQNIWIHRWVLGASGPHARNHAALVKANEPGLSRETLIMAEYLARFFKQQEAATTFTAQLTAR